MKIIELENIGKKYILRQEKGAFIKDVLPRLFIPKEEKEFWALKDINLEVGKGECLGIVGRNGAGKSTLLNLIAGISSPTEGNVKVKGKLSTLLTLGAGFHPELSGIDNIYLNGVILGLKISEIKERLKEIVKFSELNGFINQPLYTYSSGMMLRLGFSIAVHINFDILLIDEILSVGDISFQEKCIKKINSFKEEGKTLIIASQSLEL
ncbi:MAG: ABC transporter ATP-binding protein, partial [Candidatus Omnitrophota bacterium]